MLIQWFFTKKRIFGHKLSVWNFVQRPKTWLWAALCVFTQWIGEQSVTGTEGMRCDLIMKYEKENIKLNCTLFGLEKGSAAHYINKEKTHTQYRFRAQGISFMNLCESTGTLLSPLPHIHQSIDQTLKLSTCCSFGACIPLYKQRDKCCHKDAHSDNNAGSQRRN